MEGYALHLSFVPYLGLVSVLKKGALLPEDREEAIAGNRPGVQTYSSAVRWLNKMYHNHTTDIIQPQKGMKR